MAPAWLVMVRPFTTARPPLSRIITARIHFSGMSNRSDASRMWGTQRPSGSFGSMGTTATSGALAMSAVSGAFEAQPAKPRARIRAAPAVRAAVKSR